MYDIICLKHLSMASHQTQQPTCTSLHFRNKPKTSECNIFPIFPESQQTQNTESKISKEIFKETQKKADVQSVIKCSFSVH